MSSVKFWESQIALNEANQAVKKADFDRKRVVLIEKIAKLEGDLKRLKEREEQQLKKVLDKRGYMAEKLLKALWKQHQEEPPKPLTKEQQLEKQRKDAFDRFMKERCRPEPNNKETIKTIYKAYWRFCALNALVRLDKKMIETFCQTLPRTTENEYIGIKVFLDEDDVEEYDKIKQEEQGEQ